MGVGLLEWCVKENTMKFNGGQAESAGDSESPVHSIKNILFSQ